MSSMNFEQGTLKYNIVIEGEGLKALRVYELSNVQSTVIPFSENSTSICSPGERQIILPAG